MLSIERGMNPFAMTIIKFLERNGQARDQPSYLYDTYQATQARGMFGKVSGQTFHPLPHNAAF